VNLLEKQLSTVYFKDVSFPWVTLYYNCPSINATIILKITMLVIKYSYMFRLILSHPQDKPKHVAILNN